MAGPRTSRERRRDAEGKSTRPRQLRTEGCSTRLHLRRNKNARRHPALMITILTWMDGVAGRRKKRRHSTCTGSSDHGCTVAGTRHLRDSTIVRRFRRGVDAAASASIEGVDDADGRPARLRLHARRVRAMAAVARSPSAPFIHDRAEWSAPFAGQPAVARRRRELRASGGRGGAGRRFATWCSAACWRQQLDGFWRGRCRSAEPAPSRSVRACHTAVSRRTRAGAPRSFTNPASGASRSTARRRTARLARTPPARRA